MCAWLHILKDKSDSGVKTKEKEMTGDSQQEASRFLKNMTEEALTVSVSQFGSLSFGIGGASQASHIFGFSPKRPPLRHNRESKGISGEITVPCARASCTLRWKRRRMTRDRRTIAHETASRRRRVARKVKLLTIKVLAISNQWICGGLTRKDERLYMSMNTYLHVG